MSETDSGSSSSTLESSRNANKTSDSDTKSDKDVSESQLWGKFQVMLHDGDCHDDVATGAIAEHMDEKDDFVARKEDDCLFVYYPDEGVYKSDGETQLSTYISESLGFRYYNDRVLNKVVQKIRSRNRVPSNEIGKVDGKLCLENGVLDISNPDNLTLEEHTPDYYFTSKFSVEYQPDAACPKFREYLSRSVPDEDERQKLQEFAGYCLHHWGTPLDRMLLLVGPTRGGKGVFLTVIESLLGADNVLHESIQAFSNEEFGGSGLPTSVVNIDGDLGTEAVKNTGAFKKLAVGEGITVNEKYEKRLDYIPVQKHLYAANEVPEVPDADEAFYERWINIQFPQTIPRDERNPDLKDELTTDEELSGILNWCLEGYARLMGQEGFSAERTLEEKQSLWAEHGDSIARFIETQVVEEPEAEIPKDEVRSAYQQMCAQEGVSPDGIGQVTKRLKSKFGVSQTKRGSRGNRHRIYQGIDLKESKSGTNNDGEERSALTPWDEPNDSEVREEEI